jgi:hypothetical protein
MLRAMHASGKVPDSSRPEPLNARRIEAAKEELRIQRVRNGYRVQDFIEISYVATTVRPI